MGIQNGVKLFELHGKSDGRRGRGPYFKPKEGDEIVITGMSGKFPDSDDVRRFRDNLFARADLVSGDYRRWKPIHPEVPQRTGKLNGVDRFDVGFFGVPRRHADDMDPMVRMLLERAVEAAADAGRAPADLRGTATGVYVGTCFSETEKSSFYGNYRESDSITTCQRSMIAKRISYFLQLNSPAFIVDTACSSSMFALEHAYRHLKENRIQKAIVCGTHLCLHPIVSLQFARLGVLSPDGSCKSFDNAGNGYARSEAITCVVLEKKRDAKRVYAEIVHSKTNCDGYKEQGITYPSSGMQKVLMKEFYEECAVDPASLTFVEAHGTGTKVGDPEELQTLDEIFCKGRARPLHIGTIKSNIGHNEPASGLCSIVKVLIGFESGFIPPNINYSTPRSGVEALESGRLKVVTEKTPWPDDNGLVGVNSFGFGGANGHVLLKWNSKVKVNNGLPKDDLPRLVCVSGRVRETVDGVFEDCLSMDSEYINLVHGVFRKSIPMHLFNGYMIVGKEGEIERVVWKHGGGRDKLRLIFGDFCEISIRSGLDLMAIPVFSGSIQRVHEILQNEFNLNIIEILQDPSTQTQQNKIVASTSIQLALTDLIKELELEIDEIFGIGYGEITAAYFDGFLTLKESLSIVYYVSIGNYDEIRGIFKGKNMKFEKWLPVYNVDQYSNFYPQGSLDYFAQNISKPNFMPKSTPNFTNVIIGINKNIEIDDNKDVAMNPESIIDLLRCFGRLFLLGFATNLTNLYPKISYPVSRGTPMISPHIKWNHSKSYTVHLYRNEEERKSGQRVMHISVRLEDWTFLTGHVIDGRNLFPATGYLALVWESYAIILGKLMTDSSIAFEDVKFLRACNVPPEDTLTLRVIIQLENKLFEIVENNTILVTGRVYPIKDTENLTEILDPIEDDDELKMDETDIYKELRLRGYQYNNQFRAIKSFSLESNRNKALVVWNNNWITFMDNMLQVQLLSEESRSLCVPTSIKRVIINGPKHIKRTVDCGNQVVVMYNKETGIISGGGIEINGLGASVIPRRKSPEAVLETYKFVPLKSKLPEDQAVRCFVQLILENSNTIKVKAVEVIKTNDKPLMEAMQSTLGDLPLIQSDLKILTKRSDLDLNGIQIDDKSLNTESSCLILIVKDLFENPELISTALRITRDVSGFVINRQSKIGSELYKKHPQIRLLSSYKTDDEVLMLLKESADFVAKIPIEIKTDGDFSWIETLKGLCDKKVVIYSQKSPLNGLLGLINCLRREPSGANIFAMIIMDDNAPEFDINNDFYKSQLVKNLAINIFKDNQWGTYRHLLLSEAETIEKEHLYCNVTTKGDLSSLRWIEGGLSSDTKPEPENELINVHYSALNFRDIMTASGRLSADAITKDRILQECIQGFEFSGILNRDKSKRVMGMNVSGALSTMVLGDKQLLWDIPSHWSLEDAATVPVVYGTVLYSLVLRGRIKAGQSILIHSGTGGVGQAAINIASYFKCKIFVTVGTEEKKEFLKKHFPQIKPEHIGDSRSTSFEQMIFKHTNGRGVDFVLNSLAEEKLLASVRCLAYNGVFLEIGKFDLAADNQIATSLLRKQARFEGLMLDQVFVGEDRKKREIMRLITEHVRNGAIKPLIRTVFPMEKVEEAFRMMASGKHMGKVMLKLRDDADFRVFKGRPRLSCDQGKVFVIVGGLGGFGLELADWLVTRGAKKIVLTSRKGSIKNGYQARRIRFFKSYGAKVSIRNDDISTEDGCRNLLNFAETTLGPVEGIFNLAVVLKDALFENQNEESFKTSFVPKAYATRHLDQMSRKICPSLRYFVVFSSVSCGRGNPGQTNYGAANSIMERICEKRKEDGYPALAIQWGAIGDVGLVADMQDNNKELVIGGTLQQRITSCLQLLDKFLKQSEPIVGSMVVAEKRIGSGASNIFDSVLNIIGVTNLKAVSHHATFPELGMDSMMAVEIKQTLEREYEVFLTAQDIRSMTIARLKDLVSDQSESISKPIQNEFDADLPEDIKLLFRHIGEEDNSNVPIVRIKSNSSKNSKRHQTVFALAGIEGMAGIFESLSKHLSSDLTCLQFCADNHSDSIEKISESLEEIIESITNEFVIIAYSFGCVVATEMMFKLEAKGLNGKAFFIDGAPDLMTRLAKMYFPQYDDEIFQTNLLCILMTRYMPFDSIIKHKSDIVKQKTYEDKIRYVLSVSPNIEHTEKYVIEMCKAALNRLKAIRKYEPPTKRLLKSKIVLAKPTKQSLVEIPEDYGLSMLTKETVEVKVLDGNHVSILENRDLAKEIQLFLDDERKGEFPKKVKLNGEVVTNVETMI